jgi:hypothetical protein
VAIIAIALVLVVLGVVSVGLGVFNRAVVLESDRFFGAREVEVQREITQESKAFIDAMNGASIDDILAWNSLRDEVAKAAASGQAEVERSYIVQQEAIVSMICQRVGRMDGDTVAQEVRQFLVEYGNSCR